MTSHEFLYFMFGILAGICLMGMLVGLIIIWSDRPKRNCEVGTPVEQYYRFEDYCAEHTDPEAYDMCKGCPLENAYDCRITWMNLSYKKESK